MTKEHPLTPSTLLLSIFILLFFAGAAQFREPKIVTVDKCEYIKSAQAFGNPIMTHKGNCTNHVSQFQGEVILSK